MSQHIILYILCVRGKPVYHLLIASLDGEKIGALNSIQPSRIGKNPFFLKLNGGGKRKNFPKDYFNTLVTQWLIRRALVRKQEVRGSIPDI